LITIFILLILLLLLIIKKNVKTRSRDC